MRRTKRSMIDLLFTLTLFCVFSASALMVVVIGANVYRSTVSSMNENYSTRTAIAYVSEKVHEADTAGAATLTCVDGVPALALTKSGDEGDFTTYIYYSEGALRELFLRAEDTPRLAAGAEIATLSALSFEQLSPNLYRLVVEVEGGSEELLFCLHSSLAKEVLS